MLTRSSIAGEDPVVLDHEQCCPPIHLGDAQYLEIEWLPTSGNNASTSLENPHEVYWQIHWFCTHPWKKLSVIVPLTVSFRKHFKVSLVFCLQAHYDI